DAIRWSRWSFSVLSRSPYMRGALYGGAGVGEMSTRLGGVAIADQSNAEQDDVTGAYSLVGTCARRVEGPGARLCRTRRADERRLTRARTALRMSRDRIGVARDAKAEGLMIAGAGQNSKAHPACKLLEST